MIEFKNVFFSYNNVEALQNINLTITSGESVAIIGPNGSGKSTFLKIVNGILLPTSGSYCLKGEEITKDKLDKPKYSKAFHKNIGFLFQNVEHQLFCPNVYEEVAFAPKQMGLREEDIHKRVQDCLELLSITDIKHRSPLNLSGGEKKKVALASILSMNPDILVLDEPMNQIDPKGKRFLKELILNLNKAGKTIICSTHDFEYVEGIFERCIVFSENHTIIRDDKYDDVISDNEFLIKNNIK